MKGPLKRKIDRKNIRLNTALDRDRWCGPRVGLIKIARDQWWCRWCWCWCCCCRCRASFYSNKTMFPNTNLFIRAHHLRGCDLLGHRKRHAHNTSSLCAAVAQPFNLYPFQQCFVIYMAWYYGWFKNKTMKNQQKKRQQQQQQPIVCILRLLCVTKLSLFFHFIRLDIWFWSFFRVNLLIFHFEKSLTMDRFFLSRSRSVCKWWF